MNYQRREELLEKKKKKKKKQKKKRKSIHKEVLDLMAEIERGEVLTPDKCNGLRNLCEADPRYCIQNDLVKYLDKCDERMLLFINMFRGLPHEFYKYNVADTTDIRKGILDLPRSHFTPAVKVVINDCLVELKVLTRAGEVYDRSGRNLTARSRVGGIVRRTIYLSKRIPYWSSKYFSWSYEWNSTTGDTYY